MCDFCRRVYAARPGEPLSGPPQTSAFVWTDLQTFFKGRVIHHAQILFARAYCEDCRESYTLALQYGDLPHSSRVAGFPGSPSPQTPRR